MIKWLLVFGFLGLVQAKAEIQAETLFKSYREIKGHIIVQEEEKRRVLADLFTVTIGMKKINKRRELLMNEKHYVETRIRVTTTALEELKSDLDYQREKLRSRLRGLYKFNGQGAMRLIFSSQTPTDLDRNLQILKLLADKDYVLIRAYEKNLKAYSRQSIKLEGHQKRLLAIEAELRVQEKQFVVQQEEKNRIVEGIDRETLSQLIRLEHVRSESSRIETAEADPNLKIAQAFFEAKGKLPHPVDGEIVQGFGLLEDPQYGIKLRSKGVFIRAEPGTDVKSVFSGEVMFSERVPGLGNTLILSHGDRYYTVYGNNRSFEVHRGQRVAKGDVIARSGPIWHNRSPGTYFEIRHFSDFIDPEEWFEKATEGNL